MSTFEEPPSPTVTTLTRHEQQVLVAVATEAIRARLEGRPAWPAPPDSRTPALLTPGASFVTLRHGSRLLGCIGTIAPNRALIDDVAANAVNAAFADPRLPALTAAEFVDMSLEVSVLSPLAEMEVTGPDDLAASVQPGVDGLLIEAGRHRATFLPAVWDQVGSVAQFLDLLWRKAGLAPGTWPPNLTVWRYHATEFGDHGPRPPIEPA